MTNYLHDIHGLQYVDYGTMVALAGWHLSNGTHPDVAVILLNKVAKELAEAIDPRNGQAVFADPLERHYPVPERVLEDLLKVG
jgi:hypothetical protein